MRYSLRREVQMERPKFPFYIPLMFGVISGSVLIGRESLAGMRVVDEVQLLATGMCFGAAIPLFVWFLRSRRT